MHEPGDFMSLVRISSWLRRDETCRPQPSCCICCGVPLQVQSSLRFASLEQQQKLLAEVMAQHGRQKQAKGRKVQSQASKRAQTPTRTAEEKAFDKKRAAFFKGLGIRTC